MYFIKILPVSGVTKASLLALLLMLINFQSFSQSCDDCPPIDECGPCVGGLTSMTLKYDAPLLGLDAVITVSDNGGIIFTGTVADGDEFSFTSSSAGEPFVGDLVTITADVLSTVEISTSCSTPVYVGDVYDNYTVTAAESQSEYTICCSTETMESLAPTITGCPADISVNLSDSECSIAVSWTPPSVTDDCGIVDSTSNHNPDDIFFPGTTEVIYTFTDIYGNTAICSFNVIVNDVTDPVISACPVSDIIETADGSCEAIVNWTEPTVTDNCSFTVESTHAPGTAFPPGTTTVTYTATDDSGNTATCFFDVIVNDETAPVITGCSDIIATTADACEAIVEWSEITATDNCGVETFTSTHNSGDIFPVGTTTVTYTATDSTGNTSTCSFDVIVNDETAPVMTDCPSDISITTDGACEATVNWTAPTIETDNCNDALITSTHNPGSKFGIGITTVTYTATDAAGNSTSCSFNVEVKETVAPVIEGCPENINLNTLAGTPCSAQAFWEEPTVSDNCSAILTSTHKSGDYFPRGKTTVTYTATDGSGNTTTCSFSVIANDNTKPVISGCPTSDIIVSADELCEATATWDEITATDNCGSVVLESDFKSGDVFPVGTTKVTYTATDDTGNSTKCSFNVVVTETIPPVISGCPSDIIKTADASCEAVASWTEPTATDNCGNVIITSTHSSGDTFPIGTTPVTYTATDDAGNTATCTFNVVVNDETDPVLSGCPASDIIMTADASCEAVASWTEPTATDNCGNVTITSTHSSGDTFPIGTTPVTYTATDDAGNTVTCTFNVVVNDETGPVFAGCPISPIVGMAANGSCEAVVEWPEIAAKDNCGDITLSSTHNSGEVFPVGITQVTYTATDDEGNATTCSFNVIMNNNAAPVLSGCPEDIVTTVDESGQVRVDWNPPIAEVPCGNVILEASHSPGEFFSLGTTEVQYIATDDAGNSASCKFNILLSYEEIKFDIPKVITPDGDGINDEWLLTNIEKFKQNKVVIVDRWGSIIFSSSGYNNENNVWRGVNSNGGQVPSGTYFYTISVKFVSQVVEKRGFIELIR